MWAFATAASGLGLDPHRFWDLTPREYQALRKVWKQGRDFQFLLSAQQQCASFNAFGAKKADGKHFTVQDFMPGQNRAHANGKVDPLTQLEKLKAWHAAAMQGTTNG